MNSSSSNDETVQQPMDHDHNDDFPNLYCTNCFHDLNHHLYDTLEHPIIHVPLCILCFDDVRNSMEELPDEELEDRCSWCFDFAEHDLYMCANEEKGCKSQFCDTCIRNNIGDEYLQLVQKNDDWKCFTCDKSQLQKFTKAIAEGKSKSVFGKLYNEDFDSDEVKIQYVLEIFKELVTEADEAAAKLTLNALDEKDKEIRNELKQSCSNQFESVAKKSKEEMELYKNFWLRHMDIIQREESIISDILEYYEVDTSSLAIYDSEGQKFQNAREFDETQLFLKAEKALASGTLSADMKSFIERRKQSALVEDDEEGNEAHNEHSSSTSSAAGEVNKKIKYTEEVVESPAENLKELESIAKGDKLVKEYDLMEDVPQESYPPSYELVIPKSVLKAVYYASDNKLSQLAETYSIPHHISIVVSLADEKEKLPQYTKRWPFSKSVHPSVLKALFFAKNRVDLAVLCEHYRIEFDGFQVEDYGEFVDLNSSKFTLKSFCNAVESEDQNMEECKQRALSRRNQYNKKDGNGNDAGGELLLKHLNETRFYNKSGDDYDAIQERHKSIRAVFKVFDRTKNHKEAEKLCKGIPRSESTKLKNRYSSYFSDEDTPNDAPSPMLLRDRTAVAYDTSSLDESIEDEGKPSSADNMDVEKDDGCKIKETVDDADESLDEEDSLFTESPVKSIAKKSKVRGKTSSSPVLNDGRQDQSLHSSPTSKEKTAGEPIAVKESDDHSHSSTLKKEPSEESKSSTGKRKSVEEQVVIDLVSDVDEESETEKLPRSATSPPRAINGESSSLKANPSNSSGKKMLLSQSNSGVKAKGGIADYFSGAVVDLSDTISDDEDDVVPSSSKKSKTNVVSETTKEARLLEKQRLRGISAFKHFIDDAEEGIALNIVRPEADKPVYLCVGMVPQLKKHQVEGLRFIWGNVIESVSSLSVINRSTNGCILAHCMGLGKTLTIVAFVVTILTNPLISDIKDPVALSDAKTASSKAKEGISNSTANENDMNTKTGEDISKQSIDLSNVKKLFHRILIVAPKNTLQNWELEFKKWTPRDLLDNIPITVLSSINNTSMKGTVKSVRLRLVKNWFENGGVLVMSYEMFRIITVDESDSTAGKKGKKGSNENKNDNAKQSNTAEAAVAGGDDEEIEAKMSKKEKDEYKQYLLNPGPDLVIADEAHIIKNKKSKISVCLDKVKTKRRIALTGSPLQNNLEEYWCMVNWIKNQYIGTLEEYKKRFIMPIEAGTNKGASAAAILAMKKRTHVLHKKLEPIVHRRDLTILQDILLPKREFILSIRMTAFQKFLYKYYLARAEEIQSRNIIFRAYQALIRVWNHPSCAVIHYFNTQAKDAKAASNSKKHATSGKSPLNLEKLRKEIAPSIFYFSECNPHKMKEIEIRAKELEERMKNGLKVQTALKQTDPNGYITMYSPPFQSSTSNILSVKDDEYFPSIENIDEDGLALKDSDDEHAVDERMINRTGSSSNHKDDSSDTRSEDSDDDGSDLADFIVSDDDEVEFEDSEDEESDSDEEVGSDSDEDSAGDESEDEIADSDDSKSRKRKASPMLKSQNKKLRKKTKTSVHKQKSFLESDDEETGSVVEDLTENQSKSKRNKKNKSKRTTDISAAEVAEQQEEATTITTGTITQDRTIRIIPKNSKISIHTVSTAKETTNQPKSSTTGADLSTEKIEEIFDNEVELADELGDDWWKFDNEINQLAKEQEEKNIMEKYTKLNHFQLLELSNKMVTLFGLLAMSVKNQDKMLVFSQSLYTLDCIQMFLHMSNWGEKVGCMDRSLGLSSWVLNRQYLRIDGSISNRQKIIDDFNRRSQFKLLLISTKAGNMGINLQGANRVVIFDSSWNPVHDLQAIFRAYRFGQKKNVFVYRMLAAGTMEEKIYKTAVMKQTLAARVVDAQMPENQFNDHERKELLKFNEEDDELPEIDSSDHEKDAMEVEDDGNNNPNLHEEGDNTMKESKVSPKKESAVSNKEELLKAKALEIIQSGTHDVVLLDFIEMFGTSLFSSIEDHDTLFLDRVENHLNEDERRAAEEEFEREITYVQNQAIQQQQLQQQYQQLQQQQYQQLQQQHQQQQQQRGLLPPVVGRWHPQEDDLLIALQMVHRNDKDFSHSTNILNSQEGLKTFRPPRLSIAYKLRFDYLRQIGKVEKLLSTPSVQKMIQQVATIKANTERSNAAAAATVPRPTNQPTTQPVPSSAATTNGPSNSMSNEPASTVAAPEAAAEVTVNTGTGVEATAMDTTTTATAAEGKSMTSEEQISV